MRRRRRWINANAHQNVVRKVVSNLYYPGYDADDVQTECTDEGTGQSVNKQDVFLPMLLRMNWRICNFADPTISGTASRPGWRMKGSRPG